MSRLWLLSLLCLSVLCLSLVQLTRARGEFRVNETNTRILLEKFPAEVQLSLENSTGATLNATVEVEVLDPNDKSRAKTSQIQSIRNGTEKLSLTLPLAFANLEGKERNEFLWYRLHYRVIENGSSASPLAEGIISLSEITPDLFDLRVATSEMVREKGRYLARVQASHPITRRPAAGVHIDADLNIEDEDENSLKLHASKITDSNGYALLEFSIPALFPKFAYNVEPENAELHVVGKKGLITVETQNDVLVDQFAHILISSDKPLYQPGQVMHVRALVFTPAKRALATEDAQFRITDPDDTTIFRAVAKTSRFGVASIDWTIPENTRLGDYRIWVGLDGGDESSQVSSDVRISRYDLPNFTVSVDPDRTYYLPGQDAEVKVRADYLFGQPVTRGHVRVVRENEREWNYREQKWDIDEGETYEGETDASGVFSTHIPLTSDHEEMSDAYSRFKDITFAAYFTDPTSNRTEQRRFDLRVTREAIHVYIIENDEWVENRTLPMKFYVSTSYADGTPASCKLNISVADEDYADPTPSSTGTIKQLTTVRTNRHGVAKVSGVRMPRDFEEEDYVDLHVSAVDSKGKKGKSKERISFDEDPVVRVETDKALYRTGEPITAFVSSSSQDATVLVDVMRESSVIRSERVKLHGGRGSIVFPYRPEFKDKLSIVAYADFTKWRSFIDTHTVLYPHNSELKVNLRTSQASYRPGEEAQVNLSVRSPEGGGIEGALGVVVLDKAVEERFRTAQEFGSRSVPINNLVELFLEGDAQIAGVSFRDLQRLDTSKPISPDLELVADVMLSQSRRYFPSFHGGDSFERDQEVVFGHVLKEKLKPLREALESRYTRTSDYPKDEQSLRRLLLESNIDFDSFKDPWGHPYRSYFSFFQTSDDLSLVSAGADERFDTDDDFSVDRMGWPYFRSTGQAIEAALKKYHDRTGGFIRDWGTLRDESLRNGLNLDQLHDRWGQPYRFDFSVNGGDFVINIRSGGPDKRLTTPQSYSPDDFTLWTSTTDYFEDTRAIIDEALKQNSESTRRFPETEQELRAALQNSRAAFDSLRDPWNHPYYVTFKTETFNLNRAKVENRADFGATATPRATVVPVTQTVRFITLRSMGADGKAATSDDFSIASFMGVISEQVGGAQEPQASISKIAFAENRGAILGIVTDAMGAVIPRVNVTATQSVERRSFQTSTRDDGKYGLLNLPAGLYEVRFEAMGFTTSVYSNVLVRASSVTEVNISLQPGTIAETVTVSSGTESNISTEAAVVVSRNVVLKGSVVTKPGTSQDLSTPRLREYFPETLLWQPSIETDKQGRARLNFKLADNITTWKMVVVGSTEDGQIGMAEKEIRAFQPFFLEHDPPRVLTEGDEIYLPVTVRNFLERPQKVDLEMKPENWFSLLGPARKSVNVAAGDASRETFDLRAVASIKNAKQRVTAIGTEDSDAIEKPVTVHPDGEQRSVTAGDIIAERSVLELNLPETMMPNSKHGELKIYPNLMAHVMESVEGIMQRPYGCGEQTISSTYPSLLVLRHYKQNGGDSPLRARALRYVNEGYSRLLNYRDESGGFTYWGKGEPNLALTVYALRFLKAASEVISVDENVINQAGNWIVSQQQTDGSWGSYESAIPLTAYITRVLAQTGSEPSDSVKRALDFLSKNASELNEPYVLASSALAAMDAKDFARAKPAIGKLRTLSITQGVAIYWPLGMDTPFHGWGRAGQVEATSLVIQALAKYCDSSPDTPCQVEKKLIVGGLLFLLKEKDQFGVWYSTQATINALDAMLALLSKQSPVRNTSVETVVLVNGNPVQTIQIPVADPLNNPITLDITQSLNPGTNRIEFRRPGGLPMATVQAVVNFYVPWSDSSATNVGRNGIRLQVKFDKTDSRINEEITCNVETERVRGYGMLLAEIGLPPGADVDRGSLEAAMEKTVWAISQYDVLPDRVVVYLWPNSRGVKFNFKFRPRFGLNAKTAPSTVYDYYNPDSRAVVAPVTFKVR